MIGPVVDSFVQVIGPADHLNDKDRSVAEVALVLARRLDDPMTEVKDLPRLAERYVILLDRLVPDGEIPDIVSDLGIPE